jgi:hypothetical protein
MLLLTTSILQLYILFGKNKATSREIAGHAIESGLEWPTFQAFALRDQSLPLITIRARIAESETGGMPG